MLELTPYLRRLREADFTQRCGCVTGVSGLLVEASGPEAAIGERCRIEMRAGPPLTAEVVGLRNGQTLLMPCGDLTGLRQGSPVIAEGYARVPAGDALLGRIVDASGQPLDGGPPVSRGRSTSLHGPAINPLSRRSSNAVLETGVRALDCFTSIGEGQRLGIFAGSGVGKSTLLAALARQIAADVRVIALVGERGREVPHFVHEVLGDEGLATSIVVCSTADQPAVMRASAAWTATAMAETFRAQGKRVLLVLDSVSRHAMACREIGLALGEPPTTRGYTPSVFANLSRLFERAGCLTGQGSITAIYTVLAEGDDLQDPLIDAVRGMLDGHIVLSRELADQGHFPAVDVLRSLSRFMPRLVSPLHLATTRAALRLLAELDRARDMVSIGAYQAGTDPVLDQALALAPALQDFLQQDISVPHPASSALQQLSGLLQQGRGQT